MLATRGTCRCAGSDKLLDGNDNPPGVWAWSTGALEGAAALKAWQAQLARMALPVRVESSASAFSASVRQRPFGPITLLEVSGSPQRLIRDEAAIRDGARNLCFVSTMTRQTGWLEANGGRTGGEPATVTYVSGDTPFALDFETEFSFVSAMIPAEDLEALTPRYALAHGGRIDPPAGPAVAALLVSLTGQSGPPHLENRLYTHFLGMAAASIDVALEPLQDSRADRDRLLLGRIKADLAIRLTDPAQVDGDRIAARFHITRRKLQRLFQAEGTTLTRWMTAQRLARCARDLRDPRQSSRSITGIASAWGFGDMGHFSRIFRDRYRASPSSWRRDGARSSRDGESPREGPLPR